MDIRLLKASIITEGDSLFEIGSHIVNGGVLSGDGRFGDLLDKSSLYADEETGLHL